MNRSFSHTAQIVLCTGVALGSVQESATAQSFYNGAMTKLGPAQGGQGFGGRAKSSSLQRNSGASRYLARSSEAVLIEGTPRSAAGPMQGIHRLAAASIPVRGIEPSGEAV